MREDSECKNDERVKEGYSHLLLYYDMMIFILSHCTTLQFHEEEINTTTYERADHMRNSTYNYIIVLSSIIYLSIEWQRTIKRFVVVIYCLRK